jgi:hypothetical protein
MSDIKAQYFELEMWKKWYYSLVIDYPKGTRIIVDKKTTEARLRKNIENTINEYEDVIAVEVVAYRQNLKHFAGNGLIYYFSNLFTGFYVPFYLFIYLESSITRVPRPENVLYKVGQVIKHKKFELYGVIIGWDEAASVFYFYNNTFILT